MTKNETPAEPTAERTGALADERGGTPADEGAAEPADEGAAEPADEGTVEPADRDAGAPADERGGTLADEGAVEPADQDAGAHQLLGQSRALRLSTTGLPANVCYPDTGQWVLRNSPGRDLVVSA